MHILLTRPEPDAAILRAQLEALGHRVTVEPLLQIETLPIAPDALAGASGLIATSRNGLRALAASPARDIAVKLPLIAVGPGTARLAGELGFSRVITGKGTAAELVPTIVEVARALGGTLAHVRGEDTAFDLETAVAGHGVKLRPLVAYRAVPAAEIGAQTRELLAAGAIDSAILMSPRTGAIFATLIADAGLTEPVRGVVLLCLSPAVAATLEPLAAPRIEVAASPNSSALLAAITRVATLWSGV